MKKSFASGLPFEWFLGLRYTYSSKESRKDGFVSFISFLSMLSIAVGVMALIIVLSVMNGFQRDVRDRMLSVVPHMEIIGTGAKAVDWEETRKEMLKDPDILAAAPYVRGQGLLSSGVNVKGVMVRGIEPEKEKDVSEIVRSMPKVLYDKLEKGNYQIILGTDLARSLGLIPGDKVSLMIPQGRFTPAGAIPRVKQFTLAGMFNSGHYEFDSAMAFIRLDDASALFRTGGPNGLRLRLKDMQQAPQKADELNMDMPAGLRAIDWSQQNKTWFAAVQVEKRMMGIILFLIVLVGAFGLVSSLVMTVNSKRSDIAILRTLGATKGSIMRIFMIQGTLIGFFGVTLGCVAGLLIAFNVESIVAGIEGLFHVQFLPKEIYFISRMPSDPRAEDIVPIACFSMILSLLATLYPSWRASKIHPAEALRYE